MDVLERWDPKIDCVVAFNPHRARDVAMGSGSQHLILGLWLESGRPFCFRVSPQGRLFVGLALKKKRRSRKKR